MELSRGSQVDRYQIEGILGRGGMAVVYRVRHAQLGSLHAMKVLTLPSSSIRERLLAEGRAQGNLRHPNVVSVTDVVMARGAPALVMEYVDGPPLDRLIGAGPLTIEQADLLARGMLRGVAAAHRHGLIHRDIKPANVLIAIQDRQIIPKVADFGLAKTLAPDDPMNLQTRTGATMGTPAYMAPEQVRDAKNVDARADVFSMGAMLYELVTGRRPFHGDDTFELFAAITAGRYTPVEEVVADVPERMRNAIEAALRVDPDERVQTADALLELWVEDAPAVPAIPSGEWHVALVERATTLSSDSGETLPESTGSSTWGETFAVPAEPTDEVTLDAPGESGSTLRNSTTSFGSSKAPVEIGPWSWAAGGSLASIPFLLAILTLAFGEVQYPLQVAGFWAVPVFLMAMLSIGAALGLGTAERQGQRFVTSWFVLPGITLIVGALGTLVGARLVAAALPGASLTDRADMAAMGSAVAGVSDIIGLTLGVTALITTCWALAWAHSPRGLETLSARQLLLMGVALMGGTLLWLAHPWMSSVAEGPAPLAVFLTVLLFAGALAMLVADDVGLEATRIRGITATMGVFAVLLDAKAVEVQGEHMLFRKFAELHPVDGVAGAEMFATALATPNMLPMAAWTGLALVLAGISLWGSEGFPISWRQALGPLFFIVTFTVIHVGMTVQMMRNAKALGPGYMARASEWHLGVQLMDSPDGVTVVGEAGGLKDGDVVLSVNERRVDRAHGLLARLGECRCGQPTSCSLLDEGCLQGAVLNVQVARADGEDARIHDVEVPWLGGGEATVAAAPAPAAELDISQPMFDFVMEINAEVSERSGLRQSPSWDPVLLQLTRERVGHLARKQSTFQRLDQVYEDWAAVLSRVRDAGLPDVIAAVPFRESRYRREMQSQSCAKGLWSFMPETAHRAAETYGTPLRISGCRFTDDPEASWAPTGHSPPVPLSAAPYIDGDTCRIPKRRGCRVDERTDVDKSTAAALAMFQETWTDPVVQDSGAVVQLTVASHHCGYDDARYGHPRSRNIKPGIRRTASKVDDESLPRVWAHDAACDTPGCRTLPENTHIYVPEVLAAHIVAVCYFAQNYGDETVFRPWRKYEDGYCRQLDIPSRADVSGY